MKLPKLFKKKVKTEEELFLEKKLKKLPRRKRKKALKLYKLFEKGYFLRVGRNIDNKEIMKQGERLYGKIL